MSPVHKYKNLVVVFLFLSILFLVFRLTGLKDHFNLDFLQQQILEHELGGLLIFVLLFSLGNLIQIPGWLFLAAAALALGRGLGAVATYIAASISCVATFFTIRFLGGDALRKMDNRIAVNALRRMDSRPVASVVFCECCFRQPLPLTMHWQCRTSNFATT